MGIMHRDIKPENILLVEDSDTSPIMLVDFGLALEFRVGQKFSGMAGSTYYMAPEVLQEQRIYKAIQKGDLSFPSRPWDGISSSAKDLIGKMLLPSAKLRITPAQALKHPWILHHTKDAKENQDNSTSSGFTSFMQCKNVGTVPLTVASIHDEKFQQVGDSVVTPDFNEVLVNLIASMNIDDLREKRLQNGWTYTILGRNMNEEMLVLNTSEEKYLVSHDKFRKKITWKLLSQIQASSN